MKKRTTKSSKTSGKYTAQDHYFDEKYGVLRNKLKLTSPIKLELRENEALILAYDQAATTYTESHVFSSQDVCILHKLFLGEIYDWAGVYRTVDISSAGIRWCHADFVAGEMRRLDELLAKLTPFAPEMSEEEIVERIAQIHGELIMIHPFRDGNGRVTRLLCDLLLMQAGHTPTQHELFYDESLRSKYHKAIRSVWRKASYEELIAFLRPLICQR